MFQEVVMPSTMYLVDHTHQEGWVAEEWWIADGI
jgi:hypothetical protein